MQNTNKTTDKNNGTTSGPGYRSGLAYLLIGGGIGATLALLFAPKPGSQLRGDIADVTRKGYEAAAEKAKELNEKSVEIVNGVKQKADAVYDFAARKVGADTASSIVDQTASVAESLVSDTNNIREHAEGRRTDFKTA